MALPTGSGPYCYHHQPPMSQTLAWASRTRGPSAYRVRAHHTVEGQRIGVDLPIRGHSATDAAAKLVGRLGRSYEVDGIEEEAR